MRERVRTAEGDAWQVHGELRAGTRVLHGIRLMASGLDHPQYNGGVVTLEDADIDGARAFYAELSVPWGVRVPPELDWSRGRRRFHQRLMGLPADGFDPAPSVPDLSVRPAERADRKI